MTNGEVWIHRGAEFTLPKAREGGEELRLAISWLHFLKVSDADGIRISNAVTTYKEESK